MIWFFVFIIAVAITLAIAAVIPAGALGARPVLPALAVAGALAVALLAVGAALFWKHAIVALAIAAVCSLAVGVMSQKVDPSKAIGGALAAFLLMFAFSWLALQMADPLLFGRDSDLSRWIRESAGRAWPFGGEPFESPMLFVAIAVASLSAARFLRPGLKAVAVFVGTLLLFFFGFRLLEDHGFFLSDFFYRHVPASRLVVVAMIVLGIVGIVRLLANNSNHRNP